MMNQERVREMVKLAACEKQNEKEHKIAMQYFRSDFTARHLLKAFFCVTAVYALLLLSWCTYHLDTLVEHLDTIDLIGLGKNVLAIYLIFVVVYLILVDIYANLYYAKCKRGMKRYYRNLRRLERLYGEEGER